ncbi:MAG: hypothetical protein KatS3mg115_1174 [Candidatus Poribacteria bacterium]|nr:MAG: hypothetical protein KatS3mg115_1174 [Candidatus Poribacteria bacterium]
MSGQRILVIGGVATGPKAAARARRRDPEAQITIVEKGRIISYSGCGLPYYVEGLFPEVEELWRTPAGTLRDPAYFEHVKDIQVRTETLAEAIDRDRKRVRVRHLPTGSVEELPYDKLVLATGGEAVCPPIEGRELEGVTTLRSPEEAVQVRSALDAGRIRQAVIVGAGPIGVEMVEAFHARGVPVTLVEMLDQVLPTLLDFEMARLLERHLKGLGVDLRLQTKVVRILGEGESGGGRAGHRRTSPRRPGALLGGRSAKRPTGRRSRP